MGDERGRPERFAMPVGPFVLGLATGRMRPRMFPASLFDELPPRWVAQAGLRPAEGGALQPFATLASSAKPREPCAERTMRAGRADPPQVGTTR